MFNSANKMTIEQAVEILKLEKGVADLDLSNGEGNQNVQNFSDAAATILGLLEHNKSKTTYSDSAIKFRRLVTPLIKFLNDDYHPHASIIITPTSAELVFGAMAVHTEEFVKD